MATNFRNSGSGSQYSNTHGTQNNNSGSGNQFNANTINYNAQNQSDSKLLADLRVTDPRDDKRRIERRKGGLLRDSYNWILDHEAFVRWQTDTRSSLLWIRGDPGKGKTMLICGIIDELPAHMPGWDTIYFFCEATDSRLNNATAVLRSLLYLLLRKRPSLSRFIRGEHEHAGKRLFEDANGWDVLDGTFTNIVEDGGLGDFILIIDALDECTTGLEQLLDFIVRLSLLNVKIIASSRNWLSIEEVVVDASDHVYISLELNERSISAAVNRYISHKVDQLASRKRYDIDTQNYIHNRLSSKANDTFLWVALVTDQLGKPGVSERHARMKVEEFPQELDALYNRMLDQTWRSNDKDWCRRILAVVSTVYRPVTLFELMSLADLGDACNKTGILEEIIGECGSILIVKDGTVYFVHQSAKEFLLQHAAEQTMPSGIQHEHDLLFWRSLKVMSNTCRRNIYSLEEPGASLDDIDTPAPDPLGPARYACVYWVEHIGDGRRTEGQQYRQAYEFLKEHFLHWIEALSLLRSTSSGITSLFELARNIQASDESSHRKLFIQDALRFVRHCRVAIESCPLQVYASALIFSPNHSIIRQQFRPEVMDWIIKTPVVPDEWSPCLQTLEGLKGAAHLLAFSSDGATLASVSGYMTIKFWDTITGQSLRTICGDEHRIGSVVFSPKGDTLASAAAYAGITCKLWDTATGRLLNTFHSTHVVSGHTSLAFCADGEKLALGSRELVEVWDIVTGQRVQQLQMPMSPPSTGGAFSADGTLYGVFTDSACIQLFDTGTGVCSKTLDPQNTHGTSLQASLAFSRSGTRLVSCDLNGLTLWNTTTGLCVWADRSAACDYGLVTISQDGGFVAFDIRTQESKGVEIRDGKTGSILQRLPAIAPMALAFSTDGTKLISSSADRTIKVWDLMRHQRQQLNNPVAFVSDVLPSTPMSPQNRTLGEESSTPPDVMSPSPCDAVKVDRTTATEDLGALDNENKGIIAVAFSSDAKQLASLSRHNFRLWDVTTGYCLKTLHVGSQASWSASLTFSRNNVHLAVVKEEGFIAILNAATGHILQRFKAHTTGITATAFSNDGATLASSSVDQTNKLWDPSTGDCKVTMVAPDVVRYIKFSESRSQLMTEYGNIDLGSLPNASTGLSTPLTAEMTTLDSQGYVLPVEYQGAWIQKDSKSILWVPSEYRTLKYDVRGSVIALGCYSGRLLMLELSSNLLRL